MRCWTALVLLESWGHDRGCHAGKSIFFLVHCGLPEAAHCGNALAVCSRFAAQEGFRVAGQAIIPDTGAVDGARVERIRRIRSVLDQVGKVLLRNDANDGAARIVGRSSLSPAVFRLAGNVVMKHFARKNGADIFHTPYGA